MGPQAIQLVSSAIKARLNEACKAAGAVGTTFLGPLDDPNASNAPLVLFPYRVTPNESLRNAGHSVPGETFDDTEQVFENALPLDVHYMLTVGPRNQTDEGNALSVLGYALQLLNDTALLTGSAVQGEVVRLTLGVANSEEMSRIWALFPTVNYRTSVLLLASPVWIDPANPKLPAAGVVVQDVPDGQLN
jgi:hypothetical protein